MSEANDTQVGGTHYKTNGEQHWDRIWRMFGSGYFIGCITKYVERYPSKNGIEDLEKARHFVDKLIELETAKKMVEESKSQAQKLQNSEPGYPTSTNADSDPRNSPLFGRRFW